MRIDAAALRLRLTGRAMLVGEGATAAMGAAAVVARPGRTAARAASTFTATTTGRGRRRVTSSDPYSLRGVSPCYIDRPRRAGLCTVAADTAGDYDGGSAAGAAGAAAAAATAAGHEMTSPSSSEQQQQRLKRPTGALCLSEIRDGNDVSFSRGYVGLPEVVRAKLREAARRRSRDNGEVGDNTNHADVGGGGTPQAPPAAGEGRPRAVAPDPLETFFVTASFYRFVEVERPEALARRLRVEWGALGVRGRTYVAREGVNAQISIPIERIAFDASRVDPAPGASEPHCARWAAFLEQMRGVPELGAESIGGLNFAIKQPGQASFAKNTVRARREIVAASDPGEPGIPFDAILAETDSSCAVDATTWNRLLASRERNGGVVIDMRNSFEHSIGHFDGALLPQVATFRESLPLIDQILRERGHDPEAPVMMYCTGGIRCSKAAAYLRACKWENLVQLKGGVVHYAQQLQAEGRTAESMFVGSNFVFDERLAEEVTEDVVGRCTLCGEPTSRHTNCRNEACHALILQCPACDARLAGNCSPECQTVSELPEDEYKEYLKRHSRDHNHAWRVSRDDRRADLAKRDDL